MVKEMDVLGYDVVTLGERELNFGQQYLLDTFKKTKIDVVSANLVFADSKKPFVKPYVIRKICTVRVAVTGLLGKEMKIRQLAKDPALEVLDPTETAKKLIPELRKKADVIVVLSHLGLTDTQKLTIDVPGIDVLVFGHQGGLFKTFSKTQDAITIRGGERGQYLPQLHLVVDEGKITAFDGDVVTLDDKVPADDNMSKAIDNYNTELNKRFEQANQKVVQDQGQKTQLALAGEHYLGEKNCRRCHEAEYQMYVKQDHAHAFDTLVKNQRDSTPECLPCHVVGMGQPGGFVSKQSTPDLVNVQCENCHGMGTKHPDTGAIVGPDVCMTCHTSAQSPHFQYDEMVAKIVHWKQ
jgi:hypothetical protein